MRRVVAVVVGAGVLLGACSSDSGSDPSTTTEAPSTTAERTTTTERETTTTERETTTSSSTSTTSTTTTVVETTTTVPPSSVPVEPVPGQPNPACTYVVQPGDSLNIIVANLADPAITVEALAAENGIADVNVINVGAALDVCPGNGIDDVTGVSRVPETTAPPETAPPATDPAAPPPSGLASGVAAQQDKLTQLFSGYGMSPLAPDGQSGRLTRQQLCAARLALGLPITREDMAPGSEEEVALMSATGVPIPATAPVQAGRWVLIDQTCQVMFVGDGEQIVFVFPTSTGTPEFRTRDQSASRVFRYDPAVHNNGWHDSTQYPAGADNPLNGNMYKPLYFDRGQAIHGANTVPTSPASHGCARLRVNDQQRLVDWLGLSDQRSEMWNAADRIGLVVSIQGRY